MATNNTNEHGSNFFSKILDLGVAAGALNTAGHIYTSSSKNMSPVASMLKGGNLTSVTQIVGKNIREQHNTSLERQVETSKRISEMLSNPNTLDELTSICALSDIIFG